MKTFWKSKTFWLGVLQLGVAVGSYASDQLTQGLALTVSGVLTVVLRFLTKEEISLK